METFAQSLSQFWCPTLIDFLDGGPAAAARHPGPSGHVGSGAPVQLSHDRFADRLHLGELVGVLLLLRGLVAVQPPDGLLTLLLDGGPVFIRDLALEVLILNRGLHVEAIALKAILGRDPLLLLVVFSLVLFGLIHHPLNLVLAPM